MSGAGIERLLRATHIALLVSAATLLIAAAAAPAAQPPASDLVTLRPCFGAASRDASKPCPDPSLRLTIFPAPADAPLEPNAPCHAAGRTKLLFPCRFGVPPVAGRRAAEAIALVGDSHASHWRAAVEVVAHAKRQPAISIARSHCPFIEATVALPRPDRRGCRAWNRAVRSYLARHDEIRTLLISNRTRARFVRARGKTNFKTQVAGHISLWRSLPRSIQRIVVLRDTPRSSAASALCVQRAYARKRAAGPRCARMRRRALQPDASVVAARRMRSSRVRAIDLSSFFCDAEHCFPVIGGAHVHKDVDHMTAAFARTLGPYLLRAYAQILRSAPGVSRAAPTPA